jgi:3-hydroxy-9,10-secoandrosta-1,3,5(10)-triene-9,17-dione monooxygenase reductase component
MTTEGQEEAVAELRRAYSRFATGVAVVSARLPDGWLGNTVSSFNTVSLDPPLVLFSMQRSRRSYQAWQAAGEFVVNVLSREQATLSDRFAGSGPDKWSGVAARAGRFVDAPVIEGSLAVFECRVWARYDGGDHLIIVGEVLGCEHASCPIEPLVFYDRGYHTIGLLRTPQGGHHHG